MSCETKETTIGDLVFSCTQYPATQGLTFKLRLIKVLGPAIAKIAPMLGNKGASDSDEIAAFGEALEKLFITSPDEIVTLIKDMTTGGHVSAGGERFTAAKFEEVFSGDNLMNVYPLFFFVIRTNYAAFFKGQKMGDLLTKLGESI